MRCRFFLNGLLHLCVSSDFTCKHLTYTENIYIYVVSDTFRSKAKTMFLCMSLTRTATHLNLPTSTVRAPNPTGTPCQHVL